MVVGRTVTQKKKEYLEGKKEEEILNNFTVDSPVPFDLNAMLQELENLNTEMITGSSGRPKQGDFHGKLSRMIARLENKITEGNNYH